MHGRLSKHAPWLAAACIIVFVGLLTPIAPQYYLTLLITIGLTTIAASGLTLLLISGQASLGHAAYMGIGGYTAAILARDYGVTPTVALATGVFGSALAAYVVGLVTLRLKGHFLPLATLAVGIAVSGLFVGAARVTGGASGLSEIPPLSIGVLVITNDKVYAIIIWTVAIIALGGFTRLQNSRTGRAIAALRTSDEMARVFGADTVRLKLMIFVTAGAVAGLAGALYAFYYRFLSPAPFGLSASINLLIACVLGGVASPFGAILGAVTITVLETLLQNVVARALGLSGNVEMIVFGVILIAVLLKWPGGIWSAISRFWPQYIVDRSSRNVELAPAPQDKDSDILTVTGIGKSYDGLRALRDVSFSVAAREIVGLIGPNGAGKSTTFNIVTGLTLPSTGSVKLMGDEPPAKVSMLVGIGVTRTFQHVKLIPTLSVLENVAFGAYSQGRAGILAGMFGADRAEEAATFAKAWRALEIVDLEDLAHSPASLLAMGQARLVEVARALVSRPRLLLLDEPAAGLRTGEKLKLVTLLHRLKRSGTSVLLVEHDMDLVMNCVDRVIVLDRGAGLAQGTPDSVRADPRVISAYLGT